MPDLSFGSYTLPVYSYEDFSYTISNPGSVQLPITKTSGLPSGFFTNTTSNLTFAGNGASLTAGSIEGFSYNVLDPSGNVSASSSNTVPVGPGRFTDLCGNGVSGRSYVFYKGEPISNIRLRGPFTMCNAVTSVPSLPPGLRFVVSGSNVDISGTPLTTLATSNYQLIGKDAASGSKVITTSNTYTVRNERILYNFSGTPIINMDVDVTIPPTTLTAAFPPYPSGGILKYTWKAFPNGIRVSDNGSNDVTTSNVIGFSTTDISHVFAISGTPTLAAAISFANAGATSAGLTFSITGTTLTTPTIISNTEVTFAFNETVLFDTPTIKTLYSGVTVDPTANYFRAQTYFAATGPGSNISNIFSPDLRSDLSLLFVPSSSRAYLYAVSGTPTLGASTANYTIRAINSNSKQRDIVTPISVADDRIIWDPVTPLIDTCYNFILSSPLNIPRTGYYPSPIQFKATAASAPGCNVTLSSYFSPEQSDVGISLDSNGVLVGVPNRVIPFTTFVVNASSAFSPATSNTTVNIEILDDKFVFADIAASNLQFSQNRIITPFQVSVSTLSGRPIIDYAETNLPEGLSISPAGVISGTPLSSDVSGTFNIIPTTGYVSTSNSYNYTLTPDSVIFNVPQNTYTYIPGETLAPIHIQGTSYSGVTVSNYDLSLTPTYGLTVDPTGMMAGQWLDNTPPDNILPSSCNFTVNAAAGLLLKSVNIGFTVFPFLVNETFVTLWKRDQFSVLNSHLYGSSNNGVNWGAIKSKTIGPCNTIIESDVISRSMSEIQIRTSGITSTTFLIATNSNSLFRGTNLSNFQPVSLDPASRTVGLAISTLANKPGTMTWFAAGSKLFSEVTSATMLRSDDDGLTWNAETSSAILVGGNILYTRDVNNYSAITPYLTGGASLRYKDGVLMVGGSSSSSGNTMGRSTDEGSTWSNCAGEFEKECAAFCLDVSGMWVATGSSTYQSGFSNVGPWPQPSNLGTGTIKYSTDSGLRWSNATGEFNLIAYDVAYASNTWLATGISGYSSESSPFYLNIEVRFSLDGINWSLANLGTVYPFTELPNDTAILNPPLRTGPISSDGSNWKVFVRDYDVTIGPLEYIYTHDLTTDLTSNWVKSDPLNAEFGLPGQGQQTDAEARFVSLTTPNYIQSDVGDSKITLTFAVDALGPTIISPTIQSYLFYQYAAITPIQFDATTNAGQVYFFVATENLPPGITFDPLTNQLSGTPVQLGTTSITCYAKDDVGTTPFTLTFTVVVPRIVRKQDGAGAYTSLLRQYTEVLGAQNARDNRVFPTQDRALGEFMAPNAPDVVTAVNGRTSNC